MERARAVKWFLIVTCLCALPASVALLTMDRFELHRTMHPIHTRALDMFFRYVTHIGDGLTPTVIALYLLLFRRMRSFLMMAVGCALSAIVVQVLKQGPFSGMDRPSGFREQLGDLHWLEGLELNHHFSFPSGHSAAAFGMCFAMAVLLGKKGWGTALGLLAVLIAYSRVYLNQHFTLDILVGMVIGAGVSWLTYYYLYKSKYSKRSWLDRDGVAIGWVRRARDR
ncbi:MAG: phosphatase PAP2 family protein [Flavobacteriales bacterium]|nr:phosphatase PAP2 family protein [Flavobacteriales bacterium]MBP6641891.1 phosphatase PAP2 family protein [Flavobacteriales bacterium]MBP7155528.1 phosphatase PAP2 family protein [Flavobacteriales bacterium]HQV74415.1 phosphatase PAP2 family protein [Flavobacteriales bacterium]HQW40240.1 phosphatase PAP2 family protein [Flavobacteriales bacterium]